MLGRVYEYFLSQFASAEGKKGGEFYTPRCVTASGNTAAPPSSVMKSRRLMSAMGLSPTRSLQRTLSVPRDGGQFLGRIVLNY